MSQPTIGERLRHAREALPASLVQAARETKIRVDYLESMERDSFGFVVGKVYMRGMLRGYARWLGLDADEIAAEFDRTHGPPVSPPLAAAFRQPAVVVPKPRRPHWTIAAAAAAMVLLVFSLVGVMQPAENVAPPPEPPREQAAGTPSPASSPSSPAAVAEAPPATVEGVRLDVSVVGAKCWVRVLADGRETFQGTLFSGDARTFEAKDLLRVSFGALPAVRIRLNGKPVDIPPEFGYVRTFDFRPGSTSLTTIGG